MKGPKQIKQMCKHLFHQSNEEPFALDDHVSGVYRFSILGNVLGIPALLVLGIPFSIPRQHLFHTYVQMV